jgi:uncharacterized membrane protein
MKSLIKKCCYQLSGYRVALSLVVTIGIFLRLYNLGYSSFWNDESWVACDAYECPKCLESLAPFPFLMTIKFLTYLFGHSEFVYRLTPCLFGIGFIFLSYFFLRRFFGDKSIILVGTLVVALYPVFIYYSRELKQYSSDVFFTVLTLFVTEYLLEEEKSHIRWFIFTLVSLFSMWYSMPSIFVISACLLALLFRAWQLKEKPFFLNLILSGSFISVGFLALYHFYYRHLVNPRLLDWWQKRGGFPETENLGGLGNSLFNMLYSSVSFVFANTEIVELKDFYRGAITLFIAFFFVVGLEKILREKKVSRFGIYSILTLFLTLFASVFKKYAFARRLVLFYAPFLVILSSYGLCQTLKFLKDKGYYLLVSLISLLLLFPIVNPLFVEIRGEPVKSYCRIVINEVVKDLETNGFPTAVYSDFEKQWKFYYEIYFNALGKESGLLLTRRGGSLDNYLRNIAEVLSESDRAWLVFHRSKNDKEKIPTIKKYLDEHCYHMRAVELPDAVGYLCEKNRP